MRNAFCFFFKKKRKEEKEAVSELNPRRLQMKQEKRVHIIKRTTTKNKYNEEDGQKTQVRQKAGSEMRDVLSD